jgi:Inositol-pentakisphosphate 2-kinase
MNIVVSLFSNENDEKRVIRFKKIPADETTSEFDWKRISLTLWPWIALSWEKVISDFFFCEFFADKDRKSDCVFLSEPIFGDHKNELMAFIHFEELLQKYFENSDRFCVVPKIVFLDVDVHALNAFLMRDRPGKEFIVLGFSCLWPSNHFLISSSSNPWHVFAVMRRSKVIGNNYGLLYRDVAFLPKDIYKGKAINGEFKDSPTICIEIKAKQGYVMDGDDIKSCDDVKKCRYCYLQVS